MCAGFAIASKMSNVFINGKRNKKKVDGNCCSYSLKNSYSFGVDFNDPEATHRFFFSFSFLLVHNFLQLKFSTVLIERKKKLKVKQTYDEIIFSWPEISRIERNFGLCFSPKKKNDKINLNICTDLTHYRYLSVFNT